MKLILEKLNKLIHFYERAFLKILFSVSILIISCTNKDTSNESKSILISSEISTIIEEKSLHKDFIFVSRISGDCSNKAKEISQIQKLFSEEIDTSRASLLIVIQGELDYYLNEIIKDKRIVKFPVYLDQQFLFNNETIFDPNKDLFVIKENKYLIHAKGVKYNHKRINIDFEKLKHL